jgi:hypothetical protein
MKQLMLPIAVTMISGIAFASNRNGACIKGGKEIPRHAGSCEKQGGRLIPNGSSAKPNASPKLSEPAKKSIAKKTDTYKRQ